VEYKLTSKEYSEALKNNKLLGLQCVDCGNISVPPVMACRDCGSTNLDIVQLKGTGKIQTFTNLFVAAEGRENEVPYTIVIVSLDEGPWLMGNLGGVDSNKVGMEIINRRVSIGHKVFCGDKFSGGDMARPVFSLTD
jgi:uncharacterized OB-fold protein